MLNVCSCHFTLHFLKRFHCLLTWLWHRLTWQFAQFRVQRYSFYFIYARKGED